MPVTVERFDMYVSELADETRREMGRSKQSE